MPNIPDGLIRSYSVHLVASFALIVSAFLLPAAAQTPADEKPDILGLTLGMTSEEAKKILMDQGYTDIREERRHYTYSDGSIGGSPLRTEDFLAGITASKVIPVPQGRDGRHYEGVTLRFAPLPNSENVVGIFRAVENTYNPPTVSEYRAAILEKHGDPDETVMAGTLFWWFPKGSEACVNRAFSIQSQGIDILSEVFQTTSSRQITDKFRYSRTQSLEECGDFLSYRITTGSNISAQLVDVQGWVRAALAANEWVEGLREEAIKAGQAGADKPRL